MKTYFNLQFHRLMRIIRDFGLNPFLGIVLALLAFISMSLIIFKKITYSPYLYVLISLILIYSLSEKSRNEFLKTIFTRKKYSYSRLIENLVFAFPFCIFLLLKSQFIL